MQQHGYLAKQAKMKKYSSLHTFLLALSVLFIQICISSLMAIKYSIDIMPWPFYLTLFGLVNVTTAGLYVFFNVIAKNEVSYLYTVYFFTLLTLVIFIENVLTYFTNINITDFIYYSIYCAFLIFHLIYCLINRKIV
jgi:nucleoside permease NupC